MTTSVPNIQFTPQGLILPTEQEILEGVLNDIDKAFGGGLSRNLETPQGQLATSLAAIIADKNNTIAWLVNNLDPDYSDGIMQDAIGKIYFVKRKGQINSTAECELMGLAGTVIPQGFIVRDENENDWVLDETVSILEDGKVTGKFTAKGIYPAKANSINQLPQSIIGLDRVTNPNAAITGIARESRNDFAKRYKDSVAINSQGMPQTVYSKVAELSGVVSCYVIDNPKGETVRIGANNTALLPHSIYVAAVGGNDKEIAETIHRFAGNGCDFNGNTKITITDNRYQEPKPTYQIKFQRPIATPIHVSVKVKRGAILEAEQLIKESVLAEFEKSRLKIGSTIYAMGFVPDLVTKIGREYLLDVKVGESTTQLSDNVQIGIDQIPTLSESNIKVSLV